MNKKFVGSKEAAVKLVKNIRRKTARKYSAKEKIHIVLAGLRGEESIAALCLRESGLVPLTFRSPNSFMRPFVRMPRGFFHLTTSAAVLDCKTH